MPCEEIIQVVGTLIPQDKESFGSVTSHEENAIFIFEESRTLLSNQLAQGEFFKMTQKQQSFRKEPFLKDKRLRFWIVSLHPFHHVTKSGLRCCRTGSA
ncbi:hypothetical protein ACTWQL_19345 [Pseudalkalibacillus sp. R45]|uniref:hypothetical protein n=1 Tax=Pseudalkalibacillus sp. R45 TaxID=3457433 RepID=UPI003FCD0AE7